MVGRVRRAVQIGAAGAVLAAGLASAGPPTGGALPPQLTLILHVAGNGEIPIDATGVALNVTVTNPAAAGYLTVHPCLAPAPVASNLNYVADQTVPNFVVSGLDADGDVCITTMTITDVIVDVAGYIPAGSLIVPLDRPQRFLDTRDGTGATRARVTGGQVLAVPVAGVHGVPVDADTVIFNTTVVSPYLAGYVTVFPCGQPLPPTSSVNFTAGTIVPNLTIAGIGVGGAVCIFSTVDTDLVADVAAYVPAGASGLTMLPAPTRLVDTRIGLGGPVAPIDNGVRTMQVGGVNGVPAGASAALVNLTATEGTAAGYAAAFPCGVGVPLVSNLNFGRAQNVANAAIVKLAADGTMCLTANTTVHAVVDVVGYLSGAAAIVPITPRRIVDTREGVEPSCHRGIDITVDAGGMQTFRSYDTASGARLPDYQGLPVVWGAHAFVMGDCSTVVVGVADGAGQLWRFSTTGTLVENRRIAPFIPSADAVASDREVFALGAFGSVLRVDTDQVLFTLPDLGIADGGGLRNWHLIGASDDGTVLAMSALGPDTTRGLQFDVYLFATDGSLLDGVSLPVGVYPIAVSPDLAYVLSLSRVGDGGHYEVETFGNEIVATFPEVEGAFNLSALGFATSGIVNACRLPGTATSPVAGTAMRWEYFTAIRPWSTTAMPCLEVVG